MVANKLRIVYNARMFSKTLAYLLWLFSGCGCLGFHRFYLRKPVSGVIWALTGGLVGIGAIYDLFTLGRQVDIANMQAAFLQGPGAFYPYGVPGAPGSTRFVHDGSAKIVKDTPERVILSIAKRNKGIISAADLALEANISMDEAKKRLETMVTKGHAEMRIRSNGTLVFTINEFLTDDGGFADT